MSYHAYKKLIYREIETDTQTNTTTEYMISRRSTLLRLAADYENCTIHTVQKIGKLIKARNEQH